MGKLELKHLAPYLPYGLKVLRPDGKNNANNGILTVSGITYELEDSFSPSEYCLRCRDLNYCFSMDDAKPILRPLSDLTNQMPECDGSYAEVLAIMLEDIWFNDEYSQYQFCYELANGIIRLSLKGSKTVLDFLYRNHFDVEAYFNHGKGLIDAGVAISYKEAGL